MFTLARIMTHHWNAQGCPFFCLLLFLFLTFFCSPWRPKGKMFHFISCNMKDNLNHSFFFSNVTYLSVKQDIQSSHIIYDWTGAGDETTWYYWLIFSPAYTLIFRHECFLSLLQMFPVHDKTQNWLEGTLGVWSGTFTLWHFCHYCLFLHHEHKTCFFARCSVDVTPHRCIYCLLYVL